MTGFGDLLRPGEGDFGKLTFGWSSTAVTPTGVFERAGVPADLSPVPEARWLREPLGTAMPCAGALALHLDGPFDERALLDRVSGDLRDDCLSSIDEPFQAGGELIPIAACAQPGSLELLVLLGFLKPVQKFVTDYDRIRANTLQALKDIARSVKWFFRGLLVLVRSVTTRLHLPKAQPRPLTPARPLG